MEIFRPKSPATPNRPTLVLGIESASPSGGMALVDGERCLGSFLRWGGRLHSQHMMTGLRDLLRDPGCAPPISPVHPGDVRASAPQARPPGMLAVQSGSGNIFGRLMADINRTLRAVFQRVSAYTAFVTSFMDLYGFHVAGGEEFAWPQASQIEICLVARGLTDLGWYEPEFGAGLPKLPRYLKERLATRGRVLTDAEPYKSHGEGRWSF